MKKLMIGILGLFSVTAFGANFGENMSAGLSERGIQLRHRTVSCLEREAKKEFNLKEFKFTKFNADLSGLGRRFGIEGLTHGNKYIHFQAQVSDSTKRAILDCYIVSNDTEEWVTIDKNPYCFLSKVQGDRDLRTWGTLQDSILGAISGDVYVNEEKCSDDVWAED